MDMPAVGPNLPGSSGAASADEKADAGARAAAKAFEASFLAEMLKGTGLNAMPSGFGGGAGEEAFASFLTQEYARLMSERGGVGLAEQIFETLKQKARAHDRQHSHFRALRAGPEAARPGAQGDPERPARRAPSAGRRREAAMAESSAPRPRCPKPS